MSAESKYIICLVSIICLVMAFLLKYELYSLSIVVWLLYLYNHQKKPKLYNYFKKKELEKEEKLKEKAEIFFKNYSRKVYNDKEVFIRENKLEIFIKIKKTKEEVFYIKKIENKESTFKYHIYYKKGLKQFFKTKIYKKFKNLKKVQKRRF